MTGTTEAAAPADDHPADEPALVRRLPDRVWVPALVGLVLSVTFAGALLVRAGGDASLLVGAAPPWTDPAGARSSLTVGEPDEAFDGQFFYRLGVAPWATDETVEGVTFDLPALRNARWGYGALAFVASGGRADAVPWALLGLNVAAATAVGAIGGGLARASGRHTAWGLLLVLWPGFAYSLSLDTSELVASTFLLGGLLALRHRRWAPAALALTAAVLTRDTTAAVPFGVALAGTWVWWKRSGVGGPPQRWTSYARTSGGAALVVVGAVPLVAFGGWQLLQRARFGELPLTSSGDNNLSLPLGGLVEELGSLLAPSGADEAFRLVSLIGLLALLGAAAWCWRATSAPLAERVAWLPSVAVVVLLNAYLWSGATAFMRAATEAGLLSILVLLGSRRHRLVLPLTALGLAGLWALTAVAQLSKLG